MDQPFVVCHTMSNGAMAAVTMACGNRKQFSENFARKDKWPRLVFAFAVINGPFVCCAFSQKREYLRCHQIVQQKPAEIVEFFAFNERHHRLITALCIETFWTRQAFITFSVLTGDGRPSYSANNLSGQRASKMSSFDTQHTQPRRHDTGWIRPNSQIRNKSSIQRRTGWVHALHPDLTLEWNKMETLNNGKIMCWN